MDLLKKNYENQPLYEETTGETKLPNDKPINQENTQDSEAHSPPSGVLSPVTQKPLLPPLSNETPDVKREATRQRRNKAKQRQRTDRKRIQQQEQTQSSSGINQQQNRVAMDELRTIWDLSFQNPNLDEFGLIPPLSEYLFDDNNNNNNNQTTSKRQKK